MQYGTRTLQALCLRGGQASQEELAREIGIAAERLGPVLAGLHHNGYLLRVFQPQGGAQITVTEDGRRWTQLRGTVNAGMPSNTRPQTGPKPPRGSMSAPAGQPQPQPQPAPQSAPVPPPAPARMPASSPAGDAPPPRTGRLQLPSRSATTLSLPQPPPLATGRPAPAPQPSPRVGLPAAPPVAPIAAPPAAQPMAEPEAPPPAAPPAAEAVPADSGPAESPATDTPSGPPPSALPPSGEALSSADPPRRRPGRPRKVVSDEPAADAAGDAAPRKRGRPRRKPVEEGEAEGEAEPEQPGDEMVTDESGFVTHIKGRKIF